MPSARRSRATTAVHLGSCSVDTWPSSVVLPFLIVTCAIALSYPNYLAHPHGEHSVSCGQIERRQVWAASDRETIKGDGGPHIMPSVDLPKGYVIQLVIESNHIRTPNVIATMDPAD